MNGVEQTQPLEVRKDPNSEGTAAEIAQQLRLLAAIRTDMDSAAVAVSRVESVRVQLAAIARLTQDAEVAKAVAALEQRLIDVEMALVDLRQTGQGQDGVRFEAKLIGKLGYLAGALAGSDFRPTDQQVEVQGLLNTELRQRLAAIDAVLANDLATVNALLRAKNVPFVRGAIVP